MNRLRKLIIEALQTPKKKDCNCGCGGCSTGNLGPILNESKAFINPLSIDLQYHIDNNRPLTEHLYRAGSDSYFALFAEARNLYSRNVLKISNTDDLEILKETDLGHFGMFEGKKVPLDIPMLNEWNLEEAKTFKKGDKIKYQLTFRGGVGKYADAISKSKEVKTGVIKKRMKTLSGFKYELTNGLEINPSEIIGLAESINEEREDYVVVDKRNLRPLMMNYGGGQFYEKWSTEEKAQADADELNRAYQKTYGAAEGPHVVMYKSDYYSEKRKQGKMDEHHAGDYKPGFLKQTVSTFLDKNLAPAPTLP